VRFWSGWRRAFGARSRKVVKKKNWFLHHDNAPAHTALVVRQFLTSKNITVIPHHPLFAWPRPLRHFPIPQDEITAEMASFWHDWGDPRRNARGYRHTHTWELPGMHEIIGNTLGSLYTCPRRLLWRRWKLGVTVRNFFFMVKFPEFLGSPMYVVPTYLHTHISTHIHTYIGTYTHTYIHTYIHTHVHTYIHTYTRTYAHT
jgi:hypothetical protein